MARVLTKPIREHFGELKGITGATMEDGTVYRSSRTGSMTVDRTDHLRAMMRDDRAGQDLVVGGYTPRPTPGGSFCPQCHFSGWSWQHTCPHDGAEMMEWR